MFGKIFGKIFGKRKKIPPAKRSLDKLCFHIEKNLEKRERDKIEKQVKEEKDNARYETALNSAYDALVSFSRELTERDAIRRFAEDYNGEITILHCSKGRDCDGPRTVYFGYLFLDGEDQFVPVTTPSYFGPSRDEGRLIREPTDVEYYLGKHPSTINFLKEITKENLLEGLFRHPNHLLLHGDEDDK